MFVSRKKYEALERELENARQSRNTWENNYDAVMSSCVNKNRVINNLRSESDKWYTKYRQLENENNKLKEQLAEADTVIRSMDAEIDRLKSKNHLAN